ncbi:lysine--tRNA ligase, partial [Candidatus Berkelbacteria bacterium]|nr:lysine--tRNA ligase [Candidatus Berkelbacteria bacterium]
MTENKSEREIKLEKLQKWVGAKINPYPSVTPQFEPIDRARKAKEGETVATTGRILTVRAHGKSTFMDIIDPSGKIQLFHSEQELGETDYERLSWLDTGDYIWVRGEQFITKTGEITIKVKSYQLLTKSLLPIPAQYTGLDDTETRYRQRALDFKINNSAKEIITTRSKVISSIRNFLDKHGFIEITTPVLQPIPGGATAKPFITNYNALDADFYLRISDELYLKRLVVGGFERVYEIGPDFRNEGLSHMHNPEFTMCEFYWAYQNYKGLMTITEQLVREVVKKATGSFAVTYQGHKLDFEKDFVVKKYSQLILEETGINIDELTEFADLIAVVEAKKIKFENQNITVWSELVDELFKKECRPKIVEPTFVIDYPITTAPLAKKNAENPLIAEKFQLICAGGFELVNAYSELNDPLDQEARFKEQMQMRQSGWDEAQMLDENYI